jgi:HD-like signal output (HDOD) protein
MEQQSDNPLRFGAGNPPRDLSWWTARFDVESLPVLASTSESIEELRGNEQAVDAHLLAETLAADPLMTLKVLAHVAALRRSRDGTDTETLTAALVMLGITPFFRDFGRQPSVQGQFEGRPWALDGFQSVLKRSHRAANFALAFAVQRMDHDAMVIRDAALLHDFAELLMWVLEPERAVEVARLQQADPTLRTSVVQRAVYGIELPDLQHALMIKWRLPRLLVDIADDHREGVSSQARCVLLAIRLARHTATDWSNQALADDVSDISKLLNMSTGPTLELLQDIDSP